MAAHHPLRVLRRKQGKTPATCPVSPLPAPCWGPYCVPCFCACVCTRMPHFPGPTYLHTSSLQPAPHQNPTPSPPSRPPKPPLLTPAGNSATNNPCRQPLLLLQDERARKYSQEVQSLQFNVLVTTYEFIMRDRARLSKVGGACAVPAAGRAVRDVHAVPAALVVAVCAVHAALGVLGVLYALGVLRVLWVWGRFLASSSPHTYAPALSCTACTAD